MKLDEFKDLVDMYFEGDLPDDANIDFLRMIDEDPDCKRYYDAHIMLEKYITQESKSFEEKVKEKASRALGMIESGSAADTVPKEDMDALVYVLSDQARKEWLEGDTSEALSLLHKILEFRQDHSAMIMIADIYFEQKEYREAQNYYILALTDSDIPESVRPMVSAHLAVCLVNLGDNARALQMIETSLSEAPDDGLVLNDAGIVYLYIGENSKALEVLIKAEALMEEEFGAGYKLSSVYGNLAIAHHGLGNQSDALKYIDAALSLDPENEILLNNQKVIHGGGGGELQVILS